MTTVLRERHSSPTAVVAAIESRMLASFPLGITLSNERTWGHGGAK